MKQRNGFTLVEFLVVIAIIALLAGLAVFSLTRAQRTARDTQVFKDTKTLQTALEFYYTENSQYPVPTEGSSWTNPAEDGLAKDLSPFLDGLPVSPRDDDGQAYTYVVSNDGQEYALKAGLEKTDHDSLVNDIDTPLGGVGWTALNSKNELTVDASLECDDADGSYCVLNE
jgi:type II secretion system protein G